ncbi:MAG: iron-sulfur cluster carrier protein ApbC [Armatimonadaceae bacterium]
MTPNSSGTENTAATGLPGSPTEEQVRNALRSVMDPDLHKDLVSLNMIKNIQIHDGHVMFTVELTTPACPLKEKIESDCREAVSQVPGVREISIEMTANVLARRATGGKTIPGVKNVIAIASGKGGVGKSTVTVNLALALAQCGARVGIMDADIYGPSVPMLMGLDDEEVGTTAVRLPDGNVVRRIAPPERFGVPCVSMGFFVPPGQPVVWRGPMLGKTLKQFLEEVQWGDLDYLLVDMPPGTGDVTMSLAELIPLSGAVIVTTPQDVAASIAVKAMRAFQAIEQQTQGRVRVPILGFIENMAYFVAPDTGTQYYIFGRGGGQEAAEELKVPFLGMIPLDIPTRQGSDEGEPVVIAYPDSEQSRTFREIAGKLAQQVSIHARQYRPLAMA